MNAYLTFQIERYGNILNEDGFTTDVMPVNQQEDEDSYNENEKAAAWFEREAELQRLHDENNFPNSNFK